MALLNHDLSQDRSRVTQTCSVFFATSKKQLGLPWLVAATVRSLNHVHALAEKTPDGKIESVRETRLTHLGIHLLCFISIFALNALKVIPMPVLYVSLFH